MGSARDGLAGFAPSAQAGPVTPGTAAHLPRSRSAWRWCLVCSVDMRGRVWFSLAQGGLAAVEDVTGTPLPGTR